MQNLHDIHFPSGSEWLRLPVFQAAAAAAAVVLGVFVAKGGVLAGIALLGLPLGIWMLAYLFRKPENSLWWSLCVGFLSSGVSRYVDAPWGLLLDVLLVLGWLAVVFKFREKGSFAPLRNDIMAVSLAWYAMLLLELGNPEMRSVAAWFYAMRGAGLYQLLAFGLAFLLLNKEQHLDKLFRLFVFYSFLGLLWGLRQKCLGTDAAEDHWLYVEGYAMTHVLFGVLRVFSFYSDAGQFGASQATLFLVCTILALGDFPKKTKLFFALAALVGFVGFAISGTRGALALPAVGFIVYLFLSKNFRLLLVGLVVLGGAFGLLKYTFVLQGNEQVRRMRTALNPEDASLQVRLRNQITFGNYLRTRPIGGGVGSAGFWGHRFTPGTLLAETATDSYYVKVWAETGIVGLSLHLFMFGYFVGRGGAVCWRMRDARLRQKIIALFAAMCGVFVSSYGNQVYSQMPTGIFMYIAIPFIFMAEGWDFERSSGPRPTG